MGDQQHAAAERQQQVFEPADRFDVEVVGGLVQQQDVGFGHQRLRQRHALLQAAGERVDARVRIQPQPGQRGFHAGAQLPGAGGIQLGLQPVQFGQRGFVVMVLGDAIGGGLVAHQQVVGVAHALRHRVEHGDARLELRLLRHVGAGDAALARDQPIVRRRQPGHDLQQR
ncbi:hypothetical protein D3C81_1612770 [compost metagenome]